MVMLAFNSMGREVKHMIGFIIGFVVGGWFGFAVAAVLSMARDYRK